MESMSDLFVNKYRLDLGSMPSGERVDDVKLPDWAQGSAELFLKKHRQALESDIVSQNLHKWIDLIFGCKQRSLEDDNLFHPYSYEGELDLTKIEDPHEKASCEQQIKEFG